MIKRSSYLTLFPYTTLFRSHGAGRLQRRAGAGRLGRAPLHGHDRGRRLAQRRSEEHTSELQSRENVVCRLLHEKKNLVLMIAAENFAVSVLEKFHSSEVIHC